ncbi:hypothetical protein EV175_007562, partial [Coemansia sp. RSA 1933]
MQDSEYDSVVWDTSTPDNQEGGSSNTGGRADTGSASKRAGKKHKKNKKDHDDTGPLIHDASSNSTHTSTFGRIGDDGIDDKISGSHFGASGAGAPFDVAY